MRVTPAGIGIVDLVEVKEEEVEEEVVFTAVELWEGHGLSSARS